MSPNITGGIILAADQTKPGLSRHGTKALTKKSTQATHSQAARIMVTGKAVIAAIKTLLVGTSCALKFSSEITTLAKNAGTETDKAEARASVLRFTTLNLFANTRNSFLSRKI
ncbi:MAG: hypothetical protein Q8L60_10665 [Gammaproteobacteria bacterium]|nr:hypothetical protein [Gammaproteobacteria bacterium]MDP2346810.1 hypothetical protein [Gammaproteobacteria bacterium]